MAPPDVSVVVPVYEQTGVLPATLPALLALEGVRELLLVDDGSRDGSAAMLAEAARQRGSVRVITHEQNRGRAAARNTGVGAASGEVILFLDADIIPEPDVARVHAVHYGDPAVVGVVSNDQPDQLDASDPFHRYLLEHAGPRGEGDEQPLHFKYFITGYSSVRRSALEAVGAFDERITYGEDLELAYRLETRFPGGFRFASGAVVHQRGIGDLEERIGRLRAFGRNLPLLLTKHPPLAAAANLSFVASPALRPVLSEAAAAVSRRLLPGAPAPLQIPLIRHILASAVASGYREGLRR
jgi:glycosyltransferase involved in cell wall biosynthesis